MQGDWMMMYQELPLWKQEVHDAAVFEVLWMKPWFGSSPPAWQLHANPNQFQNQRVLTLREHLVCIFVTWDQACVGNTLTQIREADVVVDVAPVQRMDI
uniref:Uncharacterized protein n=1 Tax=Knipowitschia caucasica TaxID=637954 RepID=A0AAV2MEB7_KNICA